MTDHVYKEAIRKAWTQLVEDMDPGPLLDHFIVHTFFKPVKIRDLQEIPKTTDKNREILDNVCKAGPEKYNLFKKCLIDSSQSHLVDILHAKEREVVAGSDEVPIVAMARMDLQAQPTRTVHSNGNQSQHQLLGSQHSASPAPAPSQSLSETDGPSSQPASSTSNMHLYHHGSRHATSQVDSGAIPGLPGNHQPTNRETQSDGTRPSPERPPEAVSYTLHETAVKQPVESAGGTDPILGQQPVMDGAAHSQSEEFAPFEDILGNRSLKSLGRVLTKQEGFKLAMKLGVQSQDFRRFEAECDDLVKLHYTVLLHWRDNGEKKYEFMFNKLETRLREMGREDIILSLHECMKEGKCFQLRN